MFVARIVFILTALVSLEAHAARVGFYAEQIAGAFSPVTEMTVRSGESFSLYLRGSEFAVTTEGGGNVVQIDDPAVVSIMNMDLDSTVWEFDTRMFSDNEFSVASFVGRNGEFPIGRIDFAAGVPGVASISLGESTVNPWAGAGAELAVDLSGVKLTVVPLPGALLLFGSAVALLGAGVRWGRQQDRLTPAGR